MKIYCNTKSKFFKQIKDEILLFCDAIVKVAGLIPHQAEKLEIDILPYSDKLFLFLKLTEN